MLIIVFKMSLVIFGRQHLMVGTINDALPYNGKFSIRAADLENKRKYYQFQDTISLN